MLRLWCWLFHSRHEWGRYSSGRMVWCCHHSESGWCFNYRRCAAGWAVSAPDLWLEYVNNGLCGLCGNSGTLNTHGVKSAAGFPCGVKLPCICPNGRALKTRLMRK